MRIISGKFKNSLIFTPRGKNTRPTSSMLRETVFNVLQTVIQGSHFLDIFAGSGAMGIEALSRGASQVIFLENGQEALDTIKKNIEKFHIQAQATLAKGDVFRSLSRLEKEGVKFDIIYVDPPYGDKTKEKPISQKILTKIDRGNLLKEGGSLLIEEASALSLEKETLISLSFMRRRPRGRSCLFHFVKGETV